MKHAIFTCVALALAFGLHCSIDKRSDAFACNTTADCNSGRVCAGGFCVVSGSGEVIDAPRGSGVDAPRAIDAGSGSNNMCPSNCTSCGSDGKGGKTCDIDCSQQNCSSGTVTCPAGYECTISCSNQNDCRTIDCVDSASCNIMCTGAQSCNRVTCGSGACNIQCVGQSSCKTNIDCGNSCACDVSCDQVDQTCTGTVTCPNNDACSTGLGCSSMFNPLCNTCQ
jgi:hypothetical protein